MSGKEKRVDTTIRRSIKLTLVAAMLYGARAHAQLFEPVKHEKPIKLELMTPKLDTSNKKKVYKGIISDTYHPEVPDLPISDDKKAYEIGTKLYEQGDYRRALNAFKLARIGYINRSDRLAIERANQAVKAAEAKMTRQAELGFKTNRGGKSNLKGVVEKVFPPSLAWLGGLKKGDVVLASNESNGVVHLKVKRNERTYDLKLKTRVSKSTTRLKSMKPSSDERRRPDRSLTGKIEHPELLASAEKLLGNYDCVLLVDSSGSMSSPMRVQTSVGSRWSWCKKQSESFYDSVGKYFPRGIMLVPFNHHFAVARGAGMAEIRKVYDTLRPAGGTNIAAPLDYVINDYFERKKMRGKVKPVAIAVLTDGEVPKNRIRDVIVETTLKMKRPNEVKITFLAVSNSQFGSPVLKALDDDLVDAGAAFDIVDTRSFDELVRYGLRKVVVAALIEHKIEKK